MAPVTSISGFPEFLPAEQLVEDFVEDTLRQVFELHGFSHVRTRAVEPLSELERKGETSKEVYLISRLQSRGESSKGEDEGRTLGLHFDLTVPLARYVLDNAAHLTFPFKRYQIQKVWRGERPQEGRFREFTQADIDLIAQDALPPHFEIEAPLVMAEALSRLPIPPAVIHVNSRKVLQGACEALGISDIPAVLTVIDKREKVPHEVFMEMLSGLGLEEAAAAKIDQLAEINGFAAEVVDRVRELGLQSELLEEGLAEVAALLRAAGERAPGRVKADFKIARGLDYYTGMVYETFLTGAESVGSICSGGRYDQLVSDGKHTYPGVGMSIGVTRLLSIMFSRSWLQASRAVPTAVLVAVQDEDSRGQSEAVAAILRSRGIPTEVCPNAQKWGKQIKYAERRGIPYVWFPSTGEVKDLRNFEQVEADPHTWQIDPQALRPQILATPATPSGADK